ncbi:hypothetical protein BC940DRAFT_238711 [Gongronella butleri]|nr:hypothetical protein BC940DRAFT_238711 [Gongronella butleri]
MRPVDDYRAPQKIGFGAVGGGSSHYFWVLEIMAQLEQRGHQTTLYTRGESMRFAREYGIDAHLVGGTTNFLNTKGNDTRVAKGMQHQKPNLLEFASRLLPMILSMYPEGKNTPLFIFYARTSYVTTDIPSFHHPTIETATLMERAQYHIAKWIMHFKITQLDLPAFQFQRDRGIPLTTSIYGVHAHTSLKLINNLFGLEAARPLGPLVEMIGPIMRKSYAPLTDDIKAFLDAHTRVAYVAFGQHAVPSEEDTVWIVQALEELINDGELDGVLWASAPNHPAVARKIHIDTQNRFFIASWVPQFAILSHKHTVLFVTHGGMGSVHEALFNRVRLFVFPFFGDQPLTARLVDQLQLGTGMPTAGIEYTHANYRVLVEKIRDALTSHDIGQRIDHYARVVQIRAKNAAQRGADIVEEVLFGAMPGGHVFHRQDVAHRIPWFSRNNYDLWLLLFVAILLPMRLFQHVVKICNQNEKIKMN